ncbi:hypothetical protein CWI39_0111p0010 [Hamiltosporidium magnivora]|uniref:Uncharacterized protein n=1 Tax=Hamiltosporidium magnivora TaxID=148818 RepID=A0A4Q9LLT3_9MICR|nr:hypothetical protein CWI39_0111p0010 [Hamiltosporidium magnivora]
MKINITLATGLKKIIGILKGKVKEIIFMNSMFFDLFKLCFENVRNIANFFKQVKEIQFMDLSDE